MCQETAGGGERLRDGLVQLNFSDKKRELISLGSWWGRGY